MGTEYFEYFFVCLLGSLGYGGLEILWRGRTHWSMLVTGGLCFIAIYLIANNSRRPLWVQALFCAVIITAAELLVGCLVNLYLGWGVWDYSALPLNLWGQVCLPYSALWLALSFPALLLSRALGGVIRGYSP